MDLAQVAHWDLNDLSHLTPQEKRELIELLEERDRRLSQRQFYSWFPDEGPLRRELYPKHMLFFKSGATYTERCFMAANRIGKTVTGAYETTCHLTGLYPDWWPGITFDHPTEGWACGETGQTTKDIVQRALLGPDNYLGTGMIPGYLIEGKPPARQGIAGAKEMVQVRHVSGGTSECQFKSYDQGAESFVGTAKHWIWPDEEPPLDVYAECRTRIMTTEGVMYLTLTPLNGLSDVALLFMPELAIDPAEVDELN